MHKDTIESVNHEKEELKRRLSNSEDQIMEIMKYFDLAVIDTSEDMRIVGSMGSVDSVFGTYSSEVIQGKNLLKAVYKLTKNTREKDAVKKNEDDFESLEDTIMNFTDGKKSEKSMKIVGENDEGELFLLKWSIKRNGKYFKSFFNIIPSNTIVEEVHAKHKKQLEHLKENMRRAFNSIHEGITLIDNKNRIIFMNENAKDAYIPSDNTLLMNANFEGKYYHELFVNEESEEVKERQDINAGVRASGEEEVYRRRKNNKNIVFRVSPTYDEDKNINGLMIVSRIEEVNNNNDSIDTNKLISAFRKVAGENKELKASITEMQNNQKWLMKKNKEYNESIFLIYNFLDCLPYPLTIINAQSMKFEFANRMFENKIGLKRQEIRGKTDENIFDKSTSEKLLKAIKAVKRTASHITYEDGPLIIRQAPVFKNEKITHIVRVYTEKKSEEIRSENG
ncbi:MAG: PAS domain-containing protein [Candidatus Kapaibacterium sp.]